MVVARNFFLWWLTLTLVLNKEKVLRWNLDHPPNLPQLWSWLILVFWFCRQLQNGPFCCTCCISLCRQDSFLCILLHHWQFCLLSQHFCFCGNLSYFHLVLYCLSDHIHLVALIWILSSFRSTSSRSLYEIACQVFLSWCCPKSVCPQCCHNHRGERAHTASRQMLHDSANLFRLLVKAVVFMNDFPFEFKVFIKILHHNLKSTLVRGRKHK